MFSVKLYSKALRLLEGRQLRDRWSFPGKRNISASVYIGYIQRPDIRYQLHVGNRPLQVLGKAYDKLQYDLYTGGRAAYFASLINNFAVLLCSGMLYPYGPYYPLSEYYDSLNFKDAANFRNATRQAWMFDGYTAGYYKEAKNISSIVLLQGNILGYENPSWIEKLIYTFTKSKKLSS